MVGGDEATVSACRPLFEAMGTSVHHLGSVGSGEAAKLANNLVGISNMLTTAEGIALGTEWGLDEDELRSVMMSSSAESFALEHWDFLTEDWGAVQPGGFEGAADILAKDLDTALSLARSLELEVPGAAVAAQRVPAYFRDLGGGD
jgi:3-hydroxyisobutyrate dehydrogenase